MPRLAALAATLLVFPTAFAAGPLEFHLRFDPKVQDKPFTGRVAVLLVKGEYRTLQRGVNWFNPRPVFARDVKGWKPGEVLVIDKSAISHPVTLDKIDPGTWTVQA